MDSPKRMENRKSGIQTSITSACWNPSKSVPTPFWKTSTRIPYAAPTESRFMTTALIGITIERKTSSRTMKLKPSTNAKTIGV